VADSTIVHRQACISCGTTDDFCLSMGVATACCQRCATSAGVTHSRFVDDAGAHLPIVAHVPAHA
jgi:hypothetical protein